MQFSHSHVCFAALREKRIKMREILLPDINVPRVIVDIVVSYLTIVDISMSS